ncbi:MAG: efflux RND transporter periplasmic adaptor subunit [Planctomycetota bacterium]
MLHNTRTRRAPATRLSGIWFGLLATLAAPSALVAQDGAAEDLRWSGGWSDGDSAWAQSFGGVQTFTKPSADAIMGFTLPNLVTAVLVAGGDEVKQGDLLVRGDDAEQLSILEQTRIRAESNLAIDRVRKQVELAGIEYQRLKDAFEGGGGSQLEVDRARLAWETSEIDLETAELNQELERTRLDQAEALLEKYRLRAPFDGLVDEVLVDPGDTLDNAQPVVRVVRIDPLWIDVPVPVEQTLELGLTEGAPAWVLIDTPERGAPVSGEILEVSPLADYASRSRRVRVAIENPGMLPPGLRVWVRFSEPSGEWADASRAVGAAQ